MPVSHPLVGSGIRFGVSVPLASQVICAVERVPLYSATSSIEPAWYWAPGASVGAPGKLWNKLFPPSCMFWVAKMSPTSDDMSAALP